MLMSRLTRITIAALCFFFAVLALAWMVLSSPLFRDARISIVSSLLSDLLGQSVTIDGDVNLSIRPDLAFVATGLRLPAEEFPDLDLAKLDLVRFGVSVGHRLRGGLYLPDIEARGLTVFLVRREDGAETWMRSAAGPRPQTRADAVSDQPDLLAFLGERDIKFSEMRVRAENRLTGFEFDFELDTFTIEQVITGGIATAQVRSSGTVNGQPIAFSGDFPNDAPSYAQGRLGALTFTMDGERPTDAARGDFDARLKLETPDTQNLLDLLKLKGVFNAVAEAEVVLSRRNTMVDLEEIDVLARFATGETARLTGRFADARFGLDFDLSVFVDFIGENTPPPPAVFFKDLRPTAAEIRVLASEGNIEIDRFSLQTNAFEEEIRDIGPFRVSRVTRSADGQLRLDGLTLVIGPPSKPYLRAQGSIDSLLTFDGYRVTGALDLPAQIVLLTLRPDEAARFGRLTGEIRLQETNGEPDLQLFRLRSEDTELWSAGIELTSGDLDDLDEMELKARITMPDGQEVLEALQLDPVEIGFVGYEVFASRQKSEVMTEARLSVEETIIETEISLRIPGTGPVLRGEIRSDEVHLDDVTKMVQALVQLARVRSVYAENKSRPPNGDDDDFQPLVLPVGAPPDPEVAPVADDLAEYQPLVLPDAQVVTEGQEDLSDFQPLVVTDDFTGLAIADVLTPENFARLIDAEIDIDISRIKGQAAVSSLHSQLKMKTGNLNLGPVRLALGKGFAELTARMDVIDAPDWVRVTGETGGWDFGNILDSLGVNMGAYGILNGRFDMTGRHSSGQAFLNSMRGSATIDMRDGRISTGLIDLAGLGVLPWLFSQERRQGYADIVCLKAPLEFTDGRIETRQTVMETRRVQLVGSGSIDIPNDRISFTAEPRPVGQPLARSAWPIEVTGSLQSPNVKVAARKSRTARVPLAMPGARALCVPDVAQLQSVTGTQEKSGPR